MAGKSARLLTVLETVEMFGHDKIFQNLIKESAVDPRALEIIYGGTASATMTEIGTSATAEFDGGAKEITTVLAATRVNTPGGSFFTFYVISTAGVITTYYAWFSKKEIFTVVCDTRVNTPGSSNFTYKDSEGAPTSYYVWFSKFEVFTVVCDTRVNTIGSTYFEYADSEAAPTEYYVWFSKKEVFTVTCPVQASIPESSYFTFSDSEGAPTDFYIWFNKGAGADPTPGGTAIEADISGATSGTDVAAIVAPLINAKAGCVSGAVAAVVTVTMATKGDPTDAADFNTTCTIAVTEAGGADPTGTGTGAECDISGATTADDVGVIVAGVINGLAGTGATNTTGTVTVTMATVGDPAAAVDVDSGYAITVTENGGADPGHATFTGAECDISGATTADDVGVIVAGVINALAGTGASNTTGTVTVTMATKGNPTDAVDIDTGYVITVTELGGADPAVAGATGAECDISASTTAADVGTVAQGVINALGDVTASGTATVTIKNDNEGVVTPTVDGAAPTGFTITQIDAGVAAFEGAHIYIASDQADDTDAADKDMRKAVVIGWNKLASGVKKIKAEEIALAGATKTILAELLWHRLIHVGGSDWGTADQNAKGNVSLGNIDHVIKYLTITAAVNEGEGGVVWVPADCHAMIAEMELTLNDLAVAAAGDGAIVSFTKYGFDNTRNNRATNLKPDNPVIPISVTLENPHAIKKWPTKATLHGSDTAKLTLAEGKINTATVFNFKAYVLLWYKESTTVQKTVS